jgi:hypothetical protein
LSLATDENATCRYATTAGVSYGAMPNPFTTTGGTAHATLVTGLSDGGSYGYFVRCQDGAGNANTTDFTISFSVGNTSGLVAAYGFNASSGTTALDSSGLGNTGTISGATWHTQGKFGSALAFDGVNDVVMVNDAPALDLTTSMTAEAWVYPTNATNYRNVVMKLNNDESIYWLGVSPGPRAFVDLMPTGAAEVALESSATLPLNAWSHLAFVYNSGTLQFYVNGVVVETVTTGSTLPISADPIRIGGDPWGQHFQGRIDEVRIYNRALTPAEIQADMSTPVN